MSMRGSSLMFMIRNERETLLAIVIAGIMTLAINLTLNLDQSYSQTPIGTIITEVSGTLAGLSLTSFAILVGLIPSLGNGLLQTRAFKGLGGYFQLLISTQIVSLVTGLVIILSGKATYAIFLPQIQLFLFLSSLSLLGLFANYLRLMFKRASMNTSNKTI